MMKIGFGVLHYPNWNTEDLVQGHELDGAGFYRRSDTKSG